MDCDGVNTDFGLRHKPAALLRCTQECAAKERKQGLEEARWTSSRYCKRTGGNLERGEVVECSQV